MQFKIQPKDCSVDISYSWKERIRILIFGKIKFNAWAFRHLMNIMQRFFWTHIDIMEQHKDPEIQKIAKMTTNDDVSGVVPK